MLDAHIMTSPRSKPIIGFLFNHDKTHQVAHTAPLIAPLFRKGLFDIHVLSSSAEQEHEARSFVAHDMQPELHFVQLERSAAGAFAAAMLGNSVPARRISQLRRNRHLFAKLDALIVPETTSFLLKSRFGLDALKLIYLPHGAGDRSVGFHPVTKQADLVLLAGRKVRDRMLDRGVITAQGHAIVGYPKFDRYRHAPRKSFFSDGKPVVLYNPHFDPLLSSWYRCGMDILRYFARQDRYNLIFAPHVMLFARRIQASAEHRHMRWRRDLPAEFQQHGNIHIDLGSENSVDMSYTRAADIYLGDVSSQVYEFLETPRPCIFIDAHGADWHGNPSYAHWRLGQVVGGVAELGTALAQAEQQQVLYAPLQRAAFADTFDLSDTPSAQRAADAIAAFLT